MVIRAKREAAFTTTLASPRVEHWAQIRIERSAFGTSIRLVRLRPIGECTRRSHRSCRLHEIATGPGALYRL